MKIINNFIAYIKGEELTFKEFQLNTIIFMIISIIIVSNLTFSSGNKMGALDIFITLPFGLWIFKGISKK